jgi:hypothetical protein
MINISESFNKLIKYTIEYVETSFSSIKLEAAEKSISLICSLFSIIAVCFIFIIASFFFGISIALILSSYLGSTIVGFIIVGVFYLIVGLVFWIKKERLIKMPLMEFILSHLFKKY